MVLSGLQLSGGHNHIAPMKQIYCKVHNATEAVSIQFSLSQILII